MESMNTDTVYTITTDSPEATYDFAAKLATHLRGDEVIELNSDLGGGKTVFAQGLAKGLGYTGEVASPTFTVSRVYQLPSGGELQHFDFYRLGSGDIVAIELAEIVGQPGIITAIEWAGNAGNVLPKDRLRVTITPTGETSRQLRLEALGPKHQQLIGKLS
jgi:tRNA threonylcarbamoyladenosine biosynthesis protein TsaE